MEKPRVFANPIDKKINNVQDLFRSDKDSRSKNPIDVNKKINEIFASRNHVYKSKVKITTLYLKSKTSILSFITTSKYYQYNLLSF